MTINCAQEEETQTPTPTQTSTPTVTPTTTVTPTVTPAATSTQPPPNHTDGAGTDDRDYSAEYW